MAMISRYGEPYGGFDKIQAIDYNKTNESKADLAMPTIKKTFGGVIFEWDNDKEFDFTTAKPVSKVPALQQLRQAYEAVRKLRGTLTDDDWWDNGDSNC